MTTLNTLIGVALGVGGAIFQSFGFIAQKTGHNQINEENKNSTKLFHKSVLSKSIWRFGIAIYTIGGALDSVALNFTAQSIISPLSALKLCIIAILSRFILKEPLSKKDIIAIAVIIIGVLMVIIFGPSSDENVGITIDELKNYFSQIPYIILVSILGGITLIDYIGVKCMERKNFNDKKNEDISYGRNFLLFSYVWIGCFFSSNNTLFIKSTVSIIVSSATSNEDLKTNLTDFATYIILVLWIICMVLMEYFRQKGLAHFGALYVIPSFSVINIILTSLIGMIYFEEYNGFNLKDALLFTAGIGITICGVLVLSFDIGKIWSELYDEVIKVSLVRYESSEYKYAQIICYGGFMSEYFQQYLFKKPAICDNREFDENWDAEQIIGKSYVKRPKRVHTNSDDHL